MAFNLGGDDYSALDEFLTKVLDMEKAGRVDRDTVIAMIEHVVSAAASDSEGEFRGYINLNTEQLIAAK